MIHQILLEIVMDNLWAKSESDVVHREWQITCKMTTKQGIAYRMICKKPTNNMHIVGNASPGGHSHIELQMS